ncbi:MAG: GNAT family N-acetyltransferase [Kiritimatiellae bacterium]|nr:GNAT family N-acetyltransferase [Kiritimatiellia bacterium]
MKPIATLYADQSIPFLMRTIGADDIELLRGWKNEHRQFFFYKKIITLEQQQAWYQRWSQEMHDHMFIIEVENRKVGCIGIRLFQDTADVYNVILGDKQFGGKGIMSQALCATVAFSQLLYPVIPVCVRVLQTNPAIAWYERNGFARIAANDEYVTMTCTRAIPICFKCNMTLPIPFRRT